MSDRPIQIRRATPDDASPLAALSRELGYPASEAETRSRLAAVLRSDEHAVFVSCDPEGAVVGWIHVFLALRIESDRFAEIGGFVVAASHRRKGHGRRLLAAAEEWSRERKVRTLRVRSRIERDDAKVFYETLGFSTTKAQRVFDKPLGRWT